MPNFQIDVFVHLVYHRSMEHDSHEKLLALYFACMEGFREFESKPRKFGTDSLLYSSEIHTLQMIGKQGSCNLTRLSELLEVSKSGISKFVNKLLKKGLILKTGNPVNRKEVIFSLTDKGKIAFQAHEKFDAKMFQTIFDLLDSYSDDQLAFLEEFLEQLVSHLNKLNKLEV